MLDREGYRPNVGIILCNGKNEVFWGKRIREHSWQFPQGGIKYGESPEQAMFRELEEETGLLREHVKIIGRTRDWLRYEVPDHFIKREIRFFYPFEVQIVDQISHEENEQGLSAHKEYKKAQVQSALRRVMGNLMHVTG